MRVHAERSEQVPRHCRCVDQRHHRVHGVELRWEAAGQHPDGILQRQHLQLRPERSRRRRRREDLAASADSARSRSTSSHRATPIRSRDGLGRRPTVPTPSRCSNRPTARPVRVPTTSASTRTTTASPTPTRSTTEPIRVRWRQADRQRRRRLSDLNDADDDNDTIDDVVDEFAVDPDNGLTTDIPVLRAVREERTRARPVRAGSHRPDDERHHRLPRSVRSGQPRGRRQRRRARCREHHRRRRLRNGEHAGQRFAVRRQRRHVDSTVRGDHRGGGADLSVGRRLRTSSRWACRSAQATRTTTSSWSSTPTAAPAASRSSWRSHGTVSQTNYGQAAIGADVLATTAGVELSFVVDPAALTAQPQVEVDAGGVVDLGPPITIPADWLDPTDENGLAVGVISTSTNATPFDALWSYLDVEYVGSAGPTIASVEDVSIDVDTTDNVAVGVTDPTVMSSPSASTPLPTPRGSSPSRSSRTRPVTTPCRSISHRSRPTSATTP